MSAGWTADRGFVFEALPTRVVFEVGAVERLAAELERVGSRRAVLFAGKRHRPLVDRLASSLGGIDTVAHDGVRPHVPVEVVADAQAVAEAHGADTILSIGGGSAIGLGKAVARERQVTLVAVPTTYAGSEMTPIWGVTGEAGKQTGSDPAVVPDLVVYDPDLTRTLPPSLVAASGLNAVAHCVEALYGRNANPITDLTALEGLRRLAAALPAVAGGADDPEPRSEALYGACLAGLALGQAGTSLHHKICHVLGGRFDLPHAETHAVLLPHSVAAASGMFGEALRPVADILEAPDPATGLARLAAAVRAPTSLAEVGLGAEDLDEAVAASTAALERAGIDLARSEVDDLLRAAYGRGRASGDERV